VESAPKLYNKISGGKPLASLVRLRTQHCGLNQYYLYRFNVKDDPQCPCDGEGIETAEHFLLLCNIYEIEREVLRKEVGEGRMKVEKLLGHPKKIKHTLEFVRETERFLLQSDRKSLLLVCSRLLEESTKG
jgi:hypothetical protein